MNSIKNAIVTVTLLAVGYGSYVVLQDPTAGQLPTSLPTEEVNSASTNVPEIQIDVVQPEADLAAQPATREDPVQQEAAVAHAPVPRAAAPKIELAPELPPLPELIEPAEESGRTNDEVVAHTPPPLDSTSPTDEPSPVATEVQPPVSTLAPGANAATEGTPATDPFSNPVAVGDVSASATADTPVSKTDTAPQESLDLFPPIDRSVGPIPPAGGEDGSAEFENAWAEAQQYLRRQELPAALKTLTPWHSEPSLNREQQNRCAEVLDQLAGTVVYSRDSYLMPAHTVQAGETLEEIAVEYEVPASLLAKINGIAPPFALTTGEEVKVLRGPFHAAVSLFKSELTLTVGGYYGGRFPVTIGRDLPPEPAIYEVAEKSHGRSYFDRRLGREVAQAEDDNRYGNHWLGLRGEHITAGHSVGIHGRPIKFSRDDVGSISLDPIDAEDVYSILSVGSQIEVRP